jgi:PAS domain S-box-containing protein
MKPPLLPLGLALLATLLAVSALLGWALDIAALKQGLASSVAMNPVTAVCLALLGLEAFRMNALNAHAGLAKAGQLAILVVVAAGLGELSDLVFGTSFSIDETLFRAALNAEARYPSRMAPNTAACLALLGVTLQLMRGGTDNRVRSAQLLAILVLLAGLLALAGNLFGVRELSGLAQYIPMAINTAIAVCCIAASMLSYSPQIGLMRFFRWESIKTRVTLTSMAIFVTCIWTLALYASSVLHDNLQRQLGVQQFATVSVRAEGINQEMGDRFSALEIIAAEITPAMLGNATVLQRLLEDRPIFNRMFNGGVFATRPDGISIAAVPLEAQRLGVDSAERDFMVAALKDGKRAVGRPVLDRVLKAPTFGMAVPIRNPEGKTIGALAGAINLGLPNFLSRITDRRYGETGDYLLTGAKHRLIITGSDMNRIMTTLPAPGIIPALDHYLQGGEGSAVYVNPLGVEILASAKHIPVAGWVLAAILPVEEAFVPIREMNQRYLLSALLLTLLAGGATWWMMRRQLAPLLATVHTLATLKESEQPIQALPVARQDEIGHLIGAFNRLLASLAQRTAALAESRARYERALNGTNDGIWEWIPATGEAYLSPRWKQLLGYEDHELPNGQEAFFSRIHGDDLARVQEAVRANFEERKPFQVELRLRCKNGEYRWFSTRGQAEWDDQGSPRRMSGSLADITERKLAEASLLEISTRKIADQAAALEAQRQSRLAALNLLEDARAARAQAESASAALAERNEQLSRFNLVAVDRELDMIGLKRQMNAMARELGRAEPFNLAFADPPPAADNAAKDSRPSAGEAQT